MRRRLIEWVEKRPLPLAVALSVLLHACTFLVTGSLKPEISEREEFRVQLARAPTEETRRFAGKPVKIPRLVLAPLVGPVKPKAVTKPTRRTRVAPVVPGIIFVPKLEVEPLPEQKWTPRVEPEGGPAVLPEYALDFYKEAPTLEQEGVRIQDLDAGGHESAILIDPEDRRNVSGFFYIPINERPGAKLHSEEISWLIEYISTKTKVQAKVQPYPSGEMLDLRELRGYPLLILPELKVRSIEDLGEYLREGGFAIIRNPRVADDVAEYLREALRGDAVSAFDINDEEPLFASFLEFADMEHPRIDATGLKIRNRIAVLSGDLRFEISRHFISVGGTAGYNASNIAKRRTFFMFNAVLYALTQPGSIGRQYVRR